MRAGTPEGHSNGYQKILPAIKPRCTLLSRRVATKDSITGVRAFSPKQVVELCSNNKSCRVGVHSFKLILIYILSHNL